MPSCLPMRLGSRPRLVLLSALMLLVELALIRWVVALLYGLAFLTRPRRRAVAPVGSASAG